MVSFVRISALSWADVLAGYAMWVMQTYLTNVWNLSLTHAAGIINIWTGVSSILPIAFAFFVDTFMGNFSMLLLSSISYSIGLGLLTMSTPPVLGHCSQYKPECISHEQKILFYSALALLSMGIAGHTISLKPFLDKQTNANDDDDGDGNNDKKIFWQIPGAVAVVIVPIVGAIALPYIHPWKLRFGIPAICTLFATILFITGSCSYKKETPQGSPLTTTVRVFFAAATKMFQPLPKTANQLHMEADSEPPHTHGLRCLDKAAIILPTKPLEEQEKDKWKLCIVAEVEEAKTGIRIIPMWVTFIVCGIVLSIGNTYFLEQANHMDRKVGKIKVPIPIFLLFYKNANYLFTSFYASLARCLGESGLKRYAPPIGIALAMVFSVVCCITAAKVETRRLHVIRDHGLLDKPDDQIPMTIFWLLPQFVLLAALDGISLFSITGFFNNQVPASMKNYLLHFTKGVQGLGTMASVLSVYIVGKVSEKNGRENWFQYTLNRSRLDRYYWTLAALSAVNLVVYIVVACFYTYKESELENEEAPEPGEISEGYQEGKTLCSCF